MTKITLYDERKGAVKSCFTVRVSRPLQGNEDELIVEEIAGDKGVDHGTINVVCDDPPLKWEVVQ